MSFRRATWRNVVRFQFVVDFVGSQMFVNSSVSVTTKTVPAGES